MSWPTKQGIYKAEAAFKASKHFKCRKILDKTYIKYDAATKQRAVYYWLHTFAMTHSKQDYYYEV